MASPDGPIEVHADKQKIEQVMKNLLGNAVKYSAKGGLIRVTSTVSAGQCEIAVEDHGIGMSPEQVKKVFDKFYRVDASNTAVEGTGLGMTIVKYIVEAHGGTIWVESEVGQRNNGEVYNTPIGFWNSEFGMQSKIERAGDEIQNSKMKEVINHVKKDYDS